MGSMGKVIGCEDQDFRKTPELFFMLKSVLLYLPENYFN